MRNKGQAREKNIRVLARESFFIFCGFKKKTKASSAEWKIIRLSM